MKHLIDQLKERRFIEAMTSPELEELMKKPVKFYIGFDPTADSLHLGHLVGIIALTWFQRHGHTPYILLGGATGKIGDPSGKSMERPLLSEELLAHNVQSIKKQLERFLDFSHPTAAPVLLNNDSWFSKLSVTDFLRDVGRHFRIGIMLSKESVKARIQSEEGISYTEFSYQLLQGYDFYYLHKHHEVTLQLGGSDQWGNITAGIEYTRKIAQTSVYGITFPLLTRSDGKKFGKSEGGAVWLSSQLCSPYKFYQYLYRVADQDVIQLLRMLTFLDMEEIVDLENKLLSGTLPPNAAQKRLAEEVTRFVHGDEGLKVALKVTQAALPGSEAVLDKQVLDEIKTDIPFAALAKQEVLGKKYTDLLVRVQLVSSKSEATRLIKNGGAYLNNKKIDDIEKMIEEEDVIESEFLLISVGKKNRFLVQTI